MKRVIAGKSIMHIGLGAMALDEYKEVPEETAIGLLQYAVQQGVQLIDTADVYGLGRNEALIGKALTNEQKQNIIIATKAGCTRPGGIGWGTDGKPEHIKKTVKESLQRLGIKKIWLCQLHAPDRNVPIKESLLAFKELQLQGLVEYIGVSNFSPAQVKVAQEVITVASVQNHYNLGYKKDEEDLLPYLTKQKIPFLPYFPLGSGQILRHPEVRCIAKYLNLTPSQVALAWITTKWPTAIPIPGTSSKEHLLENIKAAEIVLEKEIVEKLDRLW